MRKATSTRENTNATQLNVSVGNQIRFNPRISLSLSAGINKYSSADKDNYSYLGSVGLTKQILRHQSVTVGYSREAHNYNVDLIKSGIIMNHYKVQFLSENTRWPGFFSQAILTKQTDGNSRKLFFASLFYDIKVFPLIKTGVNTTYISYDSPDVALYFSPEQYLSAEAFFQIQNIHLPKYKLLYKFNLALGQQKTGDDTIQSTRRIELGLGYRLSKRIEITGEYSYNNAANRTAVGYEFHSYKLAGLMRL